jgi:hypothetical protein
MLLAQPPVMICMTFSGVGPAIDVSDLEFQMQDYILGLWTCVGFFANDELDTI